MSAMAPLFTPPASEPNLHEAESMITSCFEVFYDAGILEAVDVQVAARLSRATGETSADVLLAFALAIRAPRHGHICVDIKQAAESLTTEPQEGEEVAELTWPETSAWVKAIAQSHLVREPQEDATSPFVLDGTDLYTDRYFRYQERLAKGLLERARRPITQPADPQALQLGLTELFRPPEGKENPPGVNRQVLSAAMASLRPLTVVSGGPGMGKTWTVRNILAILFMQREIQRQSNSELLPLRVALAAPSGKAAARMRESILKNFDGFAQSLARCTDDSSLQESTSSFLREGLQTSTIHRLLGYQPRTPTRFRHNREKPLPFDVVVVDETSMVDLAMMSRVLEAVAPSAKLILLGDKYQLASVEAGTVLEDLCGPIHADNLKMDAAFVEAIDQHCKLGVTGSIETDVHSPIASCIVQYNQNHRFQSDSGIGAFASRSLELSRQDKPDPSDVLAVFDGSFQDVAMVGNTPDGRLSKETESVICDGYASYLTHLFKAAERDSESKEFHMGVLKSFDKFRLLSAHRRGQLGVEGLNKRVEELLGARFAKIGFSTRGKFYAGRPVIVRQNDYSIGLFNGDVGLVVPRTLPDGTAGLQVVFPDADEGVRYIAPARLPEHETVYAMTIHSSQGSEFEHAMVVLPTRASRVVSRELIYTGVTRAAKRMTMVGSRAVLEQALQAKLQRASGLRKILWEAE